MICIAIIKANQCIFDNMERVVVPLLHKPMTKEISKPLKDRIDDYIWSIIQEYVTFVEVYPDDILNTVCQEISKEHADHECEELFFSTEPSYSFPDRYHEIIHARAFWDGYEGNINNIGCLAAVEHTVINDTCVIITNGYNINTPPYAEIISTRKKDIISIIKRRFFFTASLINDNSIIKYYYQNPIALASDVLGLSYQDDIASLRFTFMKYNLLFLFSKVHHKINKMATRINGNHRIYNNVLVIHELEDNVCAPLGNKELHRLDFLAYGRLYDRNLTQEEKYSEDQMATDENPQKQNIIPIWSRYIMVNRRISMINIEGISCVNCGKNIDKSHKICNKCYRVKYCSTVCFDENSQYHSKDCVFPD
jgi:hypothetical protein